MGQVQCKQCRQYSKDEIPITNEESTDPMEYAATPLKSTRFSEDVPQDTSYKPEPAAPTEQQAAEPEQKKGTKINLHTSFQSEPLKKTDDELYQRTRLVAGLNQGTSSEVEKHIDEMLKSVPEAEREKARQYLYAVIGFVWHDRDGEVTGLREDRKQDLKKNVADMLRCPSQWGIDIDKVCQEHERLVIVSSAIPNADMFKACVHKAEWIVEYDHATTSLAELMQLIDNKAKQLKPLTVALANHGTDDEGQWSITNDLCVSVTGEKPELSKEALEFFKHLAGAARTRVDLLACDLAGTPSGLALIQELEELTGRHFAASTNHTGNLMQGCGDWVMESDNVDTAGIYFASQELHKWQGHLAKKGPGANESASLKGKIQREARNEKGKREKDVRHAKRRAKGQDSESESDVDDMNDSKMFKVATAGAKSKTKDEEQEQREREYYGLA
eukprot:gnl/TRDRNA2_/TRDRNA2_175890_c0_seq5.p1 gnl/TRDRNA2_/TRDRNA2_175890_c0~~gnl/TRDRNA2_/TRDRNA2_175890_c0_seq5.p1  ORF type:complete len:445 (+),score=102.82 gnl/TRDRNA2_/TRDRNA2_175890_c0_seq5:69-1403(+)